MDSFQIFVACQLAKNAEQFNHMVTRSVHSEIVFNLSPTKKVFIYLFFFCYLSYFKNYFLQITESLAKFGISDADKDLYCVLVENSNVDVVCDAIKGDMFDVTQSPLPDLSDIDEIKKVYKIKEEELMVGTLLEAVINRMSTKHIVAF